MCFFFFFFVFSIMSHIECNSVVPFSQSVSQQERVYDAFFIFCSLFLFLSYPSGRSSLELLFFHIFSFHTDFDYLNIIFRRRKVAMIAIRFLNCVLQPQNIGCENKKIKKLCQLFPYANDFFFKEMIHGVSDLFIISSKCDFSQGKMEFYFSTPPHPFFIRI